MKITRDCFVAEFTPPRGAPRNDVTNYGGCQNTRHQAPSNY